MNLKKLLAEKQQLEETKTNIKISKLKECKLTGLRIVKSAEPCDEDVLEFHDKTNTRAINRGAPLTQRLKIKKAA